MSRFTIGELAQAANVPRDTIRYYERTGLLSPPERTTSGYRLYDQSDVDRMRFICGAPPLDFPLAETKSLLNLQANDQARAADILAVTLTKLSQAELKVARLNRIRDILQQLADACPQDAATDACPILDYLVHGELRKAGATPTKKIEFGEDNHNMQTGREIP